MLTSTHCTSAFDLFVSENRIFFIDTPPLMSPSLMEKLIYQESKKSSFASSQSQTFSGGSQITSGDFTCLENALEIMSLQTAAFLLSVCHVVILMQDWFYDPNILRFVLQFENSQWNFLIWDLWLYSITMEWFSTVELGQYKWSYLIRWGEWYVRVRSVFLLLIYLFIFWNEPIYLFAEFFPFAYFNSKSIVPINLLFDNFINMVKLQYLWQIDDKINFSNKFHSTKTIWPIELKNENVKNKELKINNVRCRLMNKKHHEYFLSVSYITPFSLVHTCEWKAANVR